MTSINRTVHPGRQLAGTVDVKYTTIPHKEGIEACRKALPSTEDTNPDQLGINNINGNSVTEQHV